MEQMQVYIFMEPDKKVEKYIFEFKMLHLWNKIVKKSLCINSNCLFEKYFQKILEFF